MVSQRQVTAAKPRMGRRGGGATSRPGTLKRELMAAMDAADELGYHGKMGFVVGYLMADNRELADRIEAFLKVES